MPSNGVHSLLVLSVCLGPTVGGCYQKDPAELELEENRSRAVDLLSEAKRAGAAEYFSADFGKEASRLDEAADLVIDGRLEEADRKYRLAEIALRELARRSGQVSEQLREIRALENAVEASKKNAEDARAVEYAPAEYRDAENAYREVLRSLRTKDLRAVRLAKRSLRRAAELFEGAAARATDGAVDREFALKEKSAMLDVRARALKKKADDLTPSEWQFAESASRQAEADLLKRDFSSARRSFQDASGHYLAAVERLLGDERWARPAPPSAPGAAPPEPGEEDSRPEKRGRKTRPDPTLRPVGVDPVPAVADCFDDLESIPRQELDPDDEVYLQENFHRLARTSAATYDPETGQVLLDYGRGREARKAIDTLNTPRDHIEWEDPQTRSLKNLPPDATFSIGGNTRGLVLFPVPFRDRVRMSFEMNVLMMSSGESFGVVLNFDRRSKNCYLTDFLSVGRVLNGKRTWQPVPDRKKRRRPNTWVDKVRRVPWQVEYRLDDVSKNARLDVTYDVGGEDETTNSVSPGGSVARGFAGLYWTKVKFRLFNLRVCGILDKKRALELLREEGTGTRDSRRIDRRVTEDGAVAQVRRRAVP